MRRRTRRTSRKGKGCCSSPSTCSHTEGVHPTAVGNGGGYAAATGIPLPHAVVGGCGHPRRQPFVHYADTGAQLVVSVSQLSVEFIRSWILLHVNTRINISLISDFLIKLMKLPLWFFDTKMVGDIMRP